MKYGHLNIQSQKNEGTYSSMQYIKRFHYKSKAFDTLLFILFCSYELFLNTTR